MKEPEIETSVDVSAAKTDLVLAGIVADANQVLKDRRTQSDNIRAYYQRIDKIEVFGEKLESGAHLFFFALQHMPLCIAIEYSTNPAHVAAVAKLGEVGEFAGINTTNDVSIKYDGDGTCEYIAIRGLKYGEYGFRDPEEFAEVFREFCRANLYAI